MNFKPVQKGQVKIKPDADGQFEKSIGIDIGQQLTKVVFLNRDLKLNEGNNEENVAFYDFVIGRKEDTKQILEYVKNNSHSSGDIKCTGIFLNQYKNVCETVFGKSVKTVPTDTSIFKGVTNAFLRIGIDQLLSAPLESDPKQNIKIESEMMERMMESFKARISPDSNLPNDSIFPCLVLNLGSDSTGIYIDHTGNNYEIYSNMGWSGSVFLSLAKCLADLNDYQECFDLIKIGDFKTVDTLVQDVLSEDKNSPYGKFPRDMPIFSFGRCMDENVGNEKLEKKDMLKALLGMIIQHIWTIQMFLCKVKKINKIYICGNLFQSNELEKEIRYRMSFFPAIVELIFLDYGYNKALGALMSDC